MSKIYSLPAHRVFGKSKQEPKMTDDEVALYSARYILEDITPEAFSTITGIPLGVIVSAFENIFKNYEHN